jgi:peptidoglycan/xylan/chitin deacetylase (PgdA/CDA1 family)
MSLSPIRIDRFATLYVVQPFLAAGRNAKKACLPILMYHSISDTSEDGVTPYYRTVTHPDVFATQMRALKEQGWRGVSLAEGLEVLNGRRPSDEKVVAITFDDGFADFYIAAFPVLRENGFHATMYLPTEYIGEKPRSFKSKQCLTWSQVRELHANGMEFGSHTVSHPKLWDLEWPQIVAELRDSKSAIEDHLGGPAVSFGYPYAFPSQDVEFVARFTSELQKLGYRNCVTTAIGRVTLGDDLYTLKRLPANSCDDAELLRAKLEGAYDWLSSFQSLTKRAKARFRSAAR